VVLTPVYDRCTVEELGDSDDYSAPPPSSLTLFQAVEIPLAEAQESTIRGKGNQFFLALE
jgi:hypothetical protein